MLFNSGLSDCAYMKVPFDIKSAKAYECQLNKTIYGLNQA